MKATLTLLCALTATAAAAQFAPAAGQPGTTAMRADSSAFTAWATGAALWRGYQNLADTTLGRTTVGDPESALGPADGITVVSLGDGGTATLTFEVPLTNGAGNDFAVFENGFQDQFLELAFVEVSSDGVLFVRFPATSLTDTTRQMGPFDLLNPTQIDQLAGKYRAGWGTPFDLEVLADAAGLDVRRVTHVRVVDVVGSLDSAYRRPDRDGRPVNDPWPTPFSSGGFDLDAVGVVHQAAPANVPAPAARAGRCYPNPARAGQPLWVRGGAGTLRWFDVAGREVGRSEAGAHVPVAAGTYLLRATPPVGPAFVERVVVR